MVAREGGRAVLTASFAGTRLGDEALPRAFFTHPLQTFLVTAAIHREP